MSKNRKINKTNGSQILSKLLLVCFVLYILYSFLKWPVYDFLLVRYGKTISGKIIDERGYNGVNGHFLKEENGDEIIYEYRFEIDGEKYFGGSQSSDYDVNDSINILYLEKYPWINRPKQYLYK